VQTAAICEPSFRDGFVYFSLHDRSVEQPQGPARDKIPTGNTPFSIAQQRECASRDMIIHHMQCRNPCHRSLIGVCTRIFDADFLGKKNLILQHKAADMHKCNNLDVSDRDQACSGKTTEGVRLAASFAPKAKLVICHFLLDVVAPALHIRRDGLDGGRESRFCLCVTMLCWWLMAGPRLRRADLFHHGTW